MLGPPKRKASRLEPYWERPYGWLVPGGLSWKLGRRAGRTGQARSYVATFLVFGVRGVGDYERGRAKSMAEQDG